MNFSKKVLVLVGMIVGSAAFAAVVNDGEKCELITKDDAKVLVVSNKTQSIEIPVVTSEDGRTTLDEIKDLLQSKMGSMVEMLDIDGKTVFVSKVMVSIDPGIYFRDGRVHILLKDNILLNVLQ
ncbi:MAG: hypothetical protein J5498_08685 [Bacteroidales bacterium]|nr:hypothetical protein [Bacteroidales bacterium]MBR6363100.1 hypothetical protein [Bacteroidales bacterium]